MDLTWVEQTQTLDATDPAVRAIEDNPGWRLIATGTGSEGQTTLTYGWPWPLGEVDLPDWVRRIMATDPEGADQGWG